ncbi:hypothetical protein [Geminicoccus flavidas]|uniref:hypothetical protein n=1 Tax=Geminicoccus flavidas TaxID=2506407 RepID=UPI00190F82E4|nr:hypothetical protein [Geminicoccus flavidas]
MAAYMHRPEPSPVVLGAEWLIGATTVPTLEFAHAFRRVHDIAIGALLDDEDVGAGPGRQPEAPDQDHARGTRPSRRQLFLARRRRCQVQVPRGRRDRDDGVRPVTYDVVGLATAAGAPNVRGDLATGVSSTRRRGEPIATEIVIELASEDHAGRSLRTRHSVVHPEGQMPPTGWASRWRSNGCSGWMAIRRRPLGSTSHISCSCSIPISPG